MENLSPSAVPKDGRRERRENVSSKSISFEYQPGSNVVAILSKFQVLTSLMQQLESRINVLVDTIKNDTTIPKTMISMTVTANGNGTEPIKVTYSATNTTGSLENQPSKLNLTKL